MRKKLILILFMLVVNSVFSKESIVQARENFGIGVSLPFPMVLGLSFKMLDIDIGLYAGQANLFQDWTTLFIAVDFIIYTYTLSGNINFLDLSVGTGIYSYVWFSRFKGSVLGGAVTLGIRVPMAINFALVRGKFDVFLKIAPGIGLNCGNQVYFSWDVFTGLGFRAWIS